MQDAQFRLNQYRDSSSFSAETELRNVTVVNNALSDNGNPREPFFFFPPNSRNFVHRLVAESNTGSLFVVDEGNFVMSFASFIDNFAFQRGSFVALRSNISIFSSLFDSNLCTGNGAAVFLADDSNGTFSSIDFVNNSARYGGALYLRDAQILQFGSCHLESNSARRSGGAVHVDDAGSHAEKSLEIFDCTFQTNVAPDGGSGIHVTQWNEGRVIIAGSQFLQNNNTSNEAHGGALCITNSDDVICRVSGTRFRSNSGNTGGAVHFREVSGRLRFRSCNFTSNQAVGRTAIGSGVYLFCRRSTNVVFRETLFADNRGTNATGGAVYAYGEEMRVHVIGSSFLRNRAQDGAAIYTASLRGLSVENCTFRRNSARNRGGSICLSDLTQDVQIMNSVFENNAAVSGGAIRIHAINASIWNATFVRNEATETGGALSVVEASETTSISMSTFGRNRASIGGALYSLQPRVHVRDGCRFERNSATSFGGGIYVLILERTDKLQLEDSNMIGNTASLGGRQLITEFVFQSLVVFCRRCILSN